MQLDISEASLATFEALASDVRLKIIQLLSLKKMNIKELETELNLSSAIVYKHIKKLEEAELIKTERIPGVSGLQKVSINSASSSFLICLETIALLKFSSVASSLIF